MSIFTLLSAMKNPYSLEEAFGARDCTSQAMRAAIAKWFRLYYEREATEDSDPCQQIAYTIVNKLTKTAFGEYKASSKDEFAQAVLTALDKRRQQAMQMALVGGECFIKPFPFNGGFSFSVMSRDNVLVFGRDAEGTPTDIGTAEYTTEGRKYYTLLERRTVDAKGYLTIRNSLYCSELPRGLGQKVSLNSLERYAALPEKYTYPVPLHSLGLARMKTPIENCVDSTKDGVSVYTKAVGLIRNIDHNEAQINGEFDRGKSRIFVDETMLRNRDGRKALTDSVFTAAPGDYQNGGITIFSPALREESFLNRKREYLRNVENVIGIKRGLLSEVEAVERTAKEITSSEGDYNLTIIDIQGMWTNAVLEAVRLCGLLGQLYRVPGAHEVPQDAVVLDYGNGVLYDEEKTWADYLTMVAQGLLKPEIAVGWRFNMPTETEKDLEKIREKYMPDIQRLTAEND